MAAMNDPSPGSEPAGTAAPGAKAARCRHCYEPIYARAVRCNACSGFQNWRRYFDLSSVFLSLVIALVGVSSAVLAVLPSLIDAFSRSSDLRVLAHHCESNSISLHVENRGSRPGIVGNFEIVCYLKGAYFPPKENAAGIPVWGHYSLLGVDAGSTRVVPPRSIVQLRFPIPEDLLRKVRKDFPDTDFWKRLDDSSIRVAFRVQLLNYLIKPAPPPATLPSLEGIETYESGERIGEDESFWRYYQALGGYYLKD